MKLKKGDPVYLLCKRYAFGVVFQVISGRLIRVNDREIVIKPAKAFDLGSVKDMSTLKQQVLARDVWAILPRTTQNREELTKLRSRLLKSHYRLQRLIARGR
jgi:hypothetical protein